MLQPTKFETPALKIISSWKMACREQSGKEDIFHYRQDASRPSAALDNTYRWEIRLVDSSSGTICGSISREVLPGWFQPIQTFRVRGDGKIDWSHQFLIDAARNNSVHNPLTQK
jgi:hypothetical protein